jgi:hypothetical protein
MIASAKCNLQELKEALQQVTREYKALACCLTCLCKCPHIRELSLRACELSGEALLALLACLNSASNCALSLMDLRGRKEKLWVSF